jgi:hypothetical protein
MYCELVGGPLAGPAVRKMPPRGCFALFGTVPQFARFGPVASKLS